MLYSSQAFWNKFSLALELGSMLAAVMHAQTIRTSYQPGLDVSTFHTYRWVEIKSVHPDPNVDAQIKESIDSQLAKKKLQRWMAKPISRLITGCA
jgi:hypothetical protein